MNTVSRGGGLHGLLSLRIGIPAAPRIRRSGSGALSWSVGGTSFPACARERGGPRRVRRGIACYAQVVRTAGHSMLCPTSGPPPARGPSTPPLHTASPESRAQPGVRPGAALRGPGSRRGPNLRRSGGCRSRRGSQRTSRLGGKLATGGNRRPSGRTRASSASTNAFSGRVGGGGPVAIRPAEEAGGVGEARSEADALHVEHDAFTALSPAPCSRRRGPR